MVKRNLGCELSARSYWARAREMMLRVLTHNISILLLFLRFSTEQVLSPFSRPVPFFAPVVRSMLTPHAVTLR